MLSLLSMFACVCDSRSPSFFFIPFSLLPGPLLFSPFLGPTDVSATALGSPFLSFLPSRFVLCDSPPALLPLSLALSYHLPSLSFLLFTSSRSVPLSLLFVHSSVPLVFDRVPFVTPFHALRFSISPRIVLPVPRPRRRPFWYQRFRRFNSFQNEAFTNSSSVIFFVEETRSCWRFAFALH